MEMLHRLIGARSICLDQVQARRRQHLVNRPSNSDHRTRDCGKCLVSDIKESGVVLLGEDETMPVVSWKDVHDGERVFVLQKLEACALPKNDLAEDAIWVSFHLSSTPSRTSLPKKV